MLPQGVLVTNDKTHNLRALQDMHFEPHDLLIFGRASLDFMPASPYGHLWRRSGCSPAQPNPPPRAINSIKKPKKGGSNFDYHDGKFIGCHLHAWLKLCLWNAAISRIGLAHGHLVTDNLSYSMSVLDSSELSK
jgi:hypothetical protein